MPGRFLQCGLHRDIGSLSVGNDCHDDSWNTQRFAWRNERDPLSNCILESAVGGARLVATGTRSGCRLPSSSRRSNLALQDEADDGVRASEKDLAKWKAVEMFKVREKLLITHSLIHSLLADHAELHTGDRSVGFSRRWVGSLPDRHGGGGR